MPNPNSMRHTKSISDVVNDITSSDIQPIAASSPADKSEISVTTNNLNIKELIETAESTRKKLKDPLDKLFDERKSEINNAFRELLSNGNLSVHATISDVKAAQKIFKEQKHAGGKANFTVSEVRKSSRNRTRSERTLRTIQEKENDDSGGNDEAGDLKENEKSSSGNTESYSNNASVENSSTTKAIKKIQFAPDVDDDATFKKPTGRSKRTTKASFKTNPYQTPKNARRGYNVAVVTPGPNSEKPVSILRRPNPGEMAISMTGSPLLIAHNNIPIHVPQISIPLSDGRVMTVLANEGLDPDMSICSDIDPETQERLAALQELLAKKTRKYK